MNPIKVITTYSEMLQPIEILPQSTVTEYFRFLYLSMEKLGLALYGEGRDGI